MTNKRGLFLCMMTILNILYIINIMRYTLYRQCLIYPKFRQVKIIICNHTYVFIRKLLSGLVSSMSICIICCIYQAFVFTNVLRMHSFLGCVYAPKSQKRNNSQNSEKYMHEHISHCLSYAHRWNFLAFGSMNIMYALVRNSVLVSDY